MKKPLQEFGVIVILVFLFSYLFNFVWESFHAVFLYNGHNFDSLNYVPMISYVSSIDALLVLGIYGLVALLWRNPLWLKHMGQKQAFVVLGAGLFVGAFIEYRAVFLLERWSYNALMPTIFGIGLSPLVQLSATGIVAMWLTQRLLYKKGVYYGR